MGKKKSAVANININIPALILESLGFLFMTLALFLPSWLSNPSGLSYYPHARSWGLWYVVGARTQSHTEVWTIACKIAAKQSSMAVDASCSFPLCKWYTAKCNAYRMVTIVSYFVGGLVIFGMFLTIVAAIYSLRRRRKFTKWATMASFAGIIFPVIGVVIYIFFMQQAFDVINSAGYYQVPQPSVAMFLFGIGLFFWICAFVAHVLRGRKISKEANYEEDTFYDVQVLKAQYGL